MSRIMSYDGQCSNCSKRQNVLLRPFAFHHGLHHRQNLGEMREQNMWDAFPYAICVKIVLSVIFGLDEEDIGMLGR